MQWLAINGCLTLGRGQIKDRLAIQRKVRAKERGSPTWYQDGAVGTARYMSPEQLPGGTVSSATDIFALGVAVYEFAAGAPSLRRESRGRDNERDFVGDAARTVSPKLDTLIRRMLHKDSQLRPTTAEICAVLANRWSYALHTASARFSSSGKE
jgi:serine/threonine protein kinase